MEVGHTMNILRDKVALITGSTHGIGLAAAKAFLSEGAKVVISSESYADCSQTAEQLRLEFPSAELAAIKCDVLDGTAIDRLFDQTLEVFGRIDVVCCHVGGGPVMSTAEFTPALIDRVFEMNARSCCLTCRRAVREMLRQKTGGSIICTTSTANLGAEVALNDLTYGSSYAASKRFIAELVRGVAQQYGNHGIRCNAIAPGPTPDGMLPDEWSEAYRSVTPTKRLSRAVDHAGLMLFLASDLSAGINGCEIPVDGGLTASLYLNLDRFGVS